MAQDHTRVDTHTHTHVDIGATEDVERRNYQITWQWHSDVARFRDLLPRTVHGDVTQLRHAKEQPGATPYDRRRWGFRPYVYAHRLYSLYRQLHRQYAYTVPSNWSNNLSITVTVLRYVVMPWYFDQIQLIQYPGVYGDWFDDARNFAIVHVVFRPRLTELRIQ